MQNLDLPEFGYTPNNFSTLVDATGMSNTRFMQEFNVNHPSFYKYRNGDRSMAWKTWDELYSAVDKYLKSQTQTKVAFKSDSVGDVQFVVKDVVMKGNKKNEGVVNLKVTHDGDELGVKVKIAWDDTTNSFDIFIGKEKGVDAIKTVILNALGINIKKSNNAEFLLDIDRNSASIHSTILSKAEDALNTQRRKR